VEQFQKEYISITFALFFKKWNCLFAHMIVPQNKYNDQRFKVVDIKKNKSSSSILECTPANAFQTAFENFQVR